MSIRVLRRGETLKNEKSNRKNDENEYLVNQTCVQTLDQRSRLVLFHLESIYLFFMD